MTTEIHATARFIALQAAAPEADGSTWVHMVPAGEFSGADGRGPYVLENADAVIASSLSDGKLVVDECHSTDLAAPKGLPAPARGWIKEMEARPDGIWGRVTWTPTGKQLMAEGAYRGMSPALMVRKASPHAVVRVLRLSLTNDPNLPLSSLHSKGLDEMSLSAELLKRLGLPAGADEAAISAALTKTLDAVDLHAKTIATIAAATAAPKDATGEQLVTHLQSIATKAAGAGDADKLAATVVELQGRLNTLTGGVAKDKAEAAVDAAIAAGKPIMALRDHYITRHQKDPEGVEKELAALVSVHSGGIVDPQRRAKTATCTSSDPREIQRAAELHQKEHGGSYENAVLTVTGGL